MTADTTQQESILANEKSRLPRGTHTVVDAFFEVIDTVPAKSRQDVARAALGIIKAGLASRKADSRPAARGTKNPATLKRTVAKPAKKAAKTAKVGRAKIQATKPKLTLVQAKPRTAAAA